MKNELFGEKRIHDDWVHSMNGNSKDELGAVCDGSRPSAGLDEDLELRNVESGRERQFSRSLSQLDVEVESDTAVVSGVLRDVSISGMYVFCDHPFREQTEVTVSLGLGDGPGEKIESAGRVSRVDEGGMAIQTSEVGLQSYEHLKRLVLLNSEVPAEAEREIADHLGLRSRQRKGRT